MRKLWVMIVASAVLLGGAVVLAQTGGGSVHIMLTPGEIKWTDPPPALPSGAKIAVLEGPLANPAPFTFRLKLPDKYKIPPHWHPAIEHVTVLSGTFNLGMGERFDAGKLKALPPGSLVVIPPKSPHFGVVRGETIVQVHGVGPWGVNYVNPEDDPRKK